MFYQLAVLPNSAIFTVLDVGVDAKAVAFVVSPSAIVVITLGVGPNALSRPHIIFEFAGVFAAISICRCAMAFFFPLITSPE